MTMLFSPCRLRRDLAGMALLLGVRDNDLKESTRCRHSTRSGSTAIR
jgi:hypothetical protein